ncbi:MAG TPA: bifunctional serine/threonine-protein kinase/formylglycine-generating enzyme family protein [Blastocatellia bacterium]|nr:bifunctional serine/threonine-protein kinase/formylglycine-generating enzyme family protein [Blastocatellia bacterium]
MKQCPVCDKEMKNHLLYCPFDGQLLITKTEQDEFVGRLIEEKYRIEEKIGEGGMGKVYRATHIHIGHTVAIKILHSQLATDQTAIERFRREAMAAAQIQHPNAVAVTDFGVMKDTGMAYLVMEFLTGIELRQRIKEKKQLDYEETFLIVHQTCSALQAAHVKGIIHRDLKPDNIWMLKSEDEIPRIKVLDFGIAKLKTDTEMNQLTQQGMIVGTPYYMSPEQCRSEELDARSDIYSLGIILYEMLTGQVPFIATTPVGVVLKHANEAPKPLRELRSSIPESLEAVVLRALQKERKDRQESATQLAQEFETALYEAGIELKVLGTNTPQAIFPGAIPYPTFRTHSLSPERSRANQSAETAKAPSPALEGSGATAAGEAKKKSTTRKLFQDTALGVPLADQLRFNLSKVGVYDTAGRPKKAFLAIGALLIVTLIAGIIWLTQDPETVEQEQAVAVPPTKQPDPPVPEGMLLIRGGIFTMGTDDPSADADARPAHEVRVTDFYIDETEVTNQQYQKFVKETGRAAPPHWINGEFPSGEANLPVWSVSWEEAKAFAAWAKKRLPTESEWEYAARGSDNLMYPWGPDWSQRYSNSKEDGRDKPVAVRSYPGGKSWCGVYDMAGNVSEWVEDEYRPYRFSVAPPDPGNRVYRGGAYNFAKEELVSWARFWGKPDFKAKDIGFRCAQDIAR